MCVFCCVLFYPGTELNVFWLPGPCFAHHSCDLQSPFDSPRGVWVSLSRAFWVSHFGMSQSFHRPTLPLARVFPTLADGAEHPLATLRGFSFLTTRADTPFPFTLSQDGLVWLVWMLPSDASSWVSCVDLPCLCLYAAPGRKCPLGSIIQLP